MRSQRLRRAVSTVAVLGILFGSVGVASASTRTKIASALQQLHDLEAKISSQQAALVQMQSSMRIAAAKVDEGSRRLDLIQIQVLASRREREAIQAQYDSIRAQIAQVVVSTYIRGPLGDIQTLVNPTSIGDAADAMTYANAIVARDAERGQEAQRLAQELKERQQQEAEVMKQRTQALASLTADENALAQQFAQEQSRMNELSSARVQVAHLLTQLRQQLRAEELAAARAALAGGMEFGKWATALLGELDDAVTRNNQVAIVAWETAEFTSARWNPLATSYPMPGSTTYNSSGVRNYVSLGQGLDATRLTLSRPGYGYEMILLNMKRSADPMDTARAIRDSSWCGGCADGQYVVDLIPSVERYYDSYARQHA